jgi:hypothetical protein
MPRFLDQEEFLLEPGPSIQQPVPFTQPDPQTAKLIVKATGIR